MKFKILPTILAISIFTVTIVGSTYAFFTAITSSSRDAIDTKTAEFAILYSGGSEITGPMSLSNNREQGLDTTLDISMAPNSVLAKASILLDINEISPNLATEGFIWEVVGTKNGAITYENSGTFENTDVGDVITIVDNYKLSYDNTQFKVYFWLDGSKFGNEVIGTSFSGHISAKSEEFTGELQ